MTLIDREAAAKVCSAAQAYMNFISRGTQRHDVTIIDPSGNYPSLQLALNRAIAECEALPPAPQPSPGTDAEVRDAMTRLAEWSCDLRKDLGGKSQLCDDIDLLRKLASSRPSELKVREVSLSACDDDCEDQALVETTTCTLCWIGFSDDGRPIYPKLEKLGKFWCCPKCHSSYGAQPFTPLPSNEAALREALEKTRGWLINLRDYPMHDYKGRLSGALEVLDNALNGIAPSNATDAIAAAVREENEACAEIAKKCVSGFTGDFRMGEAIWAAGLGVAIAQAIRARQEKSE